MTDFNLRGVLASKLLCWHRLTGDEVDNLIAFFKDQQKPPEPEQVKVWLIEPQKEEA